MVYRKRNEKVQALLKQVRRRSIKMAKGKAKKPSRSHKEVKKIKKPQ